MDDQTDDEKLAAAIETLDDNTKKLLREAIERVEKEANKNTRFVQLAMSHIFHLRALAKANSAAHQVLLTMVQEMNKANVLIATQKTLASYAGYSIATIKTAIKYLEEHQWIEIRRIGNIQGYAVNSRAFWQTTPHGRMAVFNATVIISEEDQKQLIHQMQHPLKHVPILSRPHNEQTLIQSDIATNQQELDV
jgi:DNA-binding MarR family transcriptional regulator